MNSLYLPQLLSVEPPHGRRDLQWQHNHVDDFRKEHRDSSRVGNIVNLEEWISPGIMSSELLWQRGITGVKRNDYLAHILQFTIGNLVWLLWRRLCPGPTELCLNFLSTRPQMTFIQSSTSATNSIRGTFIRISETRRHPPRSTNSICIVYSIVESRYWKFELEVGQFTCYVHIRWKFR